MGLLLARWWRQVETRLLCLILGTGVRKLLYRLGKIRSVLDRQNYLSLKWCNRKTFCSVSLWICLGRCLVQVSVSAEF